MGGARFKLTCHPRPSTARGEGTQVFAAVPVFPAWVPFPHFARKRAKFAGDDNGALNPKPF
jgi:hypothetical protein